jgi:hypothetical protein
MKLKNKFLNLFQFDLVFQTTKINITVSKQPKQVQHRLAVVARHNVLCTQTHTGAAQALVTYTSSCITMYV